MTVLHAPAVDQAPNFDLFDEAVYCAQINRANGTAWVVIPATFKALSMVKESQQSARSSSPQTPPPPLCAPRQVAL